MFPKRWVTAEWQRVVLAVILMQVGESVLPRYIRNKPLNFRVFTPPLVVCHYQSGLGSFSSCYVLLAKAQVYKRCYLATGVNC